MAERLQVTVNGTVYTVEIDNPKDLEGPSAEIRVNGQTYKVALSAAGPAPAASAPVAPKAEPAPAAQPAAPVTKPAAKPVASGAGQRVTAPMPGKILKVIAKVGDQVQAKDALCTLEAMKMEMTIAATAAGTVREVHAQAGANVVFGDLLYVIE